jgi:hypothetical protein
VLCHNCNHIKNIEIDTPLRLNRAYVHFQKSQDVDREWNNLFFGSQNNHYLEARTDSGLITVDINNRGVK